MRTEFNNCNCVANYNGQCVAEKCNGAIVTLIPIRDAEHAKLHYEFAYNALDLAFEKRRTDNG